MSFAKNAQVRTQEEQDMRELAEALDSVANVVSQCLHSLTNPVVM